MIDIAHLKLAQNILWQVETIRRHDQQTVNGDGRELRQIGNI